jgi:hypothetical protein
VVVVGNNVDQYKVEDLVDAGSVVVATAVVVGVSLVEVKE